MKISRRNLPLNALRAFEAAARHCHMRRAAEELGVTHGAVSRQVRHLESLFELSLFDRSHNGLSPTAAGQRLQQVIQKSLDEMVEGLLYLDPESMAGSLVIAATPSIAVAWLLEMLGRFSNKYPEIELELKDIAPQASRVPPEVDVAICFGEPQIAQQQVLHYLFTETYFPVCSPSLISAGDGIGEFKDLLSYPLIHDQHGRWHDWFKQKGLPLGRAHRDAGRHIQLQDAYQVLTAVREGCGIGLADRIEVARELRNGNLIALFDQQGLAADQSHYLLSAKPEFIHVRAQLFVEFLLTELDLPQLLSEGK